MEEFGGKFFLEQLKNDNSVTQMGCAAVVFQLLHSTQFLILDRYLELLSEHKQLSLEQLEAVIACLTFLTISFREEIYGFLSSNMDIVRMLLDRVECRISAFKLILAVENEFASQLQNYLEELSEPSALN